jgi:esterase/lipase
LSYLDFDKLVRELYKLAKEEVPCYSVIKDLFDAIDTNKDQIIDVEEWHKIFGNVTTTDRRLTVKSTPLSYWENSPEATKIATCIARNRK